MRKIIFLTAISAAEAYGISMVPTNFLLDRHGMIVDKNLSSEKLDKKLEQIFENDQRN